MFLKHWIALKCSDSEMLTANIRAKLYLISKSGKSEGQQWPHPLYLRLSALISELISSLTKEFSELRIFFVCVFFFVVLNYQINVYYKPLKSLSWKRNTINCRFFFFNIHKVTPEVPSKLFVILWSTVLWLSFIPTHYYMSNFPWIFSYLLENSSRCGQNQT